MSCRLQYKPLTWHILKEAVSYIAVALRDMIPEYVSYYGNSKEINEIKRDLIDEQYTLLNSFVTYVLNKYNFNDYNAYSEFNTKVYNYISTYLGNSAKREELKKRLIDGTLGQDEYYN